MTASPPEKQDIDAKKPKKTKWYWSVPGFVTALWMLGGINMLLLRDIPLLLFAGAIAVPFFFPISAWLGRPKRRWVDGLWYFGAIILVLFVIPPFSISRQTTCLTQPRSEKYYGIDYSAVIEKRLEPGIPAEDNGFRLLTRTLGRPLFRDPLKDRHWDRLCRYLDLPTEIEPVSAFVDWNIFVKNLEPEEDRIIEKTVCEDHRLPWPDEKLPVVRRWTDENETALDLFVAASKMPVLYVPPMFEDNLASTILVNDDTCRRMAEGLQVRVRYRISTGETENAWDDVLAIYRLREHHRRATWCLISLLVNGSIQGTANLAAESVLIHADWSPGEIRRRADEIAPFLQPLREDEVKVLLLNERFTALDFIQGIANGNYDFFDRDDQEEPRDERSLDRLQRKVKMRFCRMGKVMIGMNKRFDEIEQQFFDDSPIESSERKSLDLSGICKTFARYGQFGMVPIVMGQVMESLLIPSFESPRISLKSRRAEIELTRLRFALEAWCRGHEGHYPADLSDLQGDIMGEIPTDPFSKESFRYVVKPTEDDRSGFLLYSVGPNGLDEEGRIWDDTPRGDDIRRRAPL